LTQTSEIATERIAAALTGLCNELDGTLDLGITICFIADENMEGRREFLARRARQVRDAGRGAAEAVAANGAPVPGRVADASRELLLSTESFVDGYLALAVFRTLGRDGIGRAAERLRAGWEGVIRSVREIADSYGMLGQGWCSEAFEREETSRERLAVLPENFTSAAVDAPPAAEP
jgi:hypothetical protein